MTSLEGRTDGSTFPNAIERFQKLLVAPIRLFDGFAYVDRDGAIPIRGVMMLDNRTGPFLDGLVRFKRGGKIGFANAKGEVVIPPRYDGALSFERGYAKVCVGCTEEKMDEYHYYAGGDWSCFDTHGKIAEQKNASHNETHCSYSLPLGTMAFRESITTKKWFE